jgi:hypothetical protein
MAVGTFFRSIRYCAELGSVLHRRPISVCAVGDRHSTTVACEFGVPPESTLGPLLYTLYVAPVSSVTASFNVRHTQYADDTQMYIALDSSDATIYLFYYGIMLSAYRI